jgi:hypothetical protein
MKNIILLLFLVISLSLISATFNENYFTFQSFDKKEIQAIGKVVSIDKVKDGNVWAYATDEQLQKFRSFGISYELLPHPSSLYEAIMAESKEDMRNWDYYPTYSAYITIMEQFQTDYPNLCQIINIGSSVQGRDLLVARISDNVGVEENEPEFFYTSSMHGDEIAGYVLMLHLIDYLLTNYGSDGRITNIVNNMDIFINPLSNPDGTYAAGNNTVTGATRYNANGIDLNRNFPDFVDGPHPDGNSWQPENIAMMDFAEERNFVMSANFHGGAEVLNYPYDTTSQRHADDAWWQYVCHEYADEAQANSPNGYLDGFNDGITNGYDWYSINGGRQDYMNYYHLCREVTLEISDIKLLPESQLLNWWNYNQESLLLYMEQAMYGIQGVVQDENGNPVFATITIPDHDYLNSHIETDAVVGNYHRLLAQGSWDLLFSATGFVSQLVENVTVTNHSTTQLNITLQPQGTVTLNGIVRDGDTNLPISSAQIELLDSPYNSITTDANGEFTFAEIYEDLYTISISKDNYATHTEQILVNSENNYYEFELFESFAISFENGQFPTDWQLGGNGNWTIVSNTASDGSYSAKSGTISHDQTSYVSVTIDVASGGNVSFFRKVSSENDYDYLKFYINNNEMAAWSGDWDWAEFTFPVSAGQNTLKWAYEKDGSVSNGSDCGWIDYVIFPPLVQENPQLSLNPVSIELEMATNSEHTETIELSNIGGGTLEFEISVPASATWLEVTPLTGSLQANHTMNVDLLFDTTDLPVDTYYCDLTIIDNRLETNFPITLTVTENDADFELAIPNVTELIGNYPNPFNPTTFINFSLHSPSPVRLDIFNVKGQKVKSFYQEYSSPGIYNIQWNGRDEMNQKVSSGIYMYHFQTRDFQKKSKMLLLQ